jgi:signal transduction histidine kinase
MEELEHASTISRNTLSFLRGSNTPTELRVSDTLAVILEIFRKKAHSKHVQLLTKWEADLRFYGSPVALRQIVSNLVGNALEAVAVGGKVLVRVREAVQDAHSGVLITVADDGPGIPVTVRTHIYEPLFTTKEETGTGLGLWVTQELVKSAGGSMKCKTAVSGPRCGTTFRVFIPTQHPATLLAVAS